MITNRKNTIPNKLIGEHCAKDEHKVSFQKKQSCFKKYNIFKID